MDETKYREQLQQIANEHQVKIYLYMLTNGNRFSTPDPMGKNEKIQGAKVEKLLEVIKPKGIEP